MINAEVFRNGRLRKHRVGIGHGRRATRRDAWTRRNSKARGRLEEQTKAAAIRDYIESWQSMSDAFEQNRGGSA